jgi:cellulose synthase/poly-beta-1,6-N-acetylglucosamine synthase-like glycosyltransferase
MARGVTKKLHVRLLEILPGVLTWATLLGAPILSYYHPAWIAIYIIVFDIYWFLKGANVATHLLHSYSSLKTHSRIDWQEWLEKLREPQSFANYLREQVRHEPDRRLRNLYKEKLARLAVLEPGRMTDWHNIYHMIILPTYQEGMEVLSSSIESYLNADFPKERMIFILATEERANPQYRENAKQLEAKYKDKFFKYLTMEHPDGLPGETKGKGANCAYAAKQVQPMLDQWGIPYQNVLVSAFDSDTSVHRNYFALLAFEFLTVHKPLQASYQPMPVFHNNIWDTPAIARVIAISSSFWQLVEASRPDRLVTFSSHSMSYKTLVDVGFWRKDLIPEDSYIFWQCFMHFNGDYRSQPLFTTVSMDAVLGENYLGTLVAQYKQKRRWAWGAIQISLVFPQFYHNKAIPTWKKLLYGYRMVEGYYFWATASIMIAILGWLPLLLGGDRFGESVLAINLPFLTRLIMTIATFFLLFSVYINLVMLPKRPARYSRWKHAGMIFQWALSPIVSSVFGSAPAVDAQTRLMLGKYMEFWVTPKIRKFELEKQGDAELLGETKIKERVK